MRLAGLRPVAVLCEVLGEDGHLARGVELTRIAARHSIRSLSFPALLTASGQEVALTGRFPAAARSAMAGLSGERFREVIRHFASGIAMITARHEDRAFGTTASAICSLSLEPPMLLVCMNRDSATGRAIGGCGHFTVNILGEDQADVAVRFARAGGDCEGLAVDTGPRGDPILVEAMATVACRVAERARGGTHTVFIAAADRAEARSGAAPLAYFRGRFGRLA